MPTLLSFRSAPRGAELSPPPLCAAFHDHRRALRRVRYDVPLDRGSVDDELGAFGCAARHDDPVGGAAAAPDDGEAGELTGDAGIHAKAVVLGTNAEKVLRHGDEVPRGRSREPGVF